MMMLQSKKTKIPWKQRGAKKYTILRHTSPCFAVCLKSTPQEMLHLIVLLSGQSETLSMTIGWMVCAEWRSPTTKQHGTWTYTDMPMVSHFWPPNGQISQGWPVLLPIQPSRLPDLLILQYSDHLFSSTIVEVQIGWVTQQAVTSHLTLAVGSLHLPSPDSTRSSASGRLRTSSIHPLPEKGNVKLTQQQLKLSISFHPTCCKPLWTCLDQDNANSCN